MADEGTRLISHEASSLGEGDPLKNSPGRIVTKPAQVAVSCALFGIGFLYGVEYAFITPRLVEIGLPRSLVPLVWLSGPLAGFTVQPLTGAMSDTNASKWGKRRPFMLVGMILTVIGSLLMALAEGIARALAGDNWEGLCLGITIFSMYWVNFSMNIIQGTHRMLVADVVPKEHQSFAQSMCTFMLGLSTLLANLVGAIHIVSILPFFSSDFMALFVIAMILMFVFVITTLVVAKEKPYVPGENSPLDDNVESKPLHDIAAVSDREMGDDGVTLLEESGEGNTGAKKNVFVVIWETAKKQLLPKYRPQKNVNIVYSCAWLAFFPFMVYFTDYMGRDVYGGDPSASKHSHKHHLYESGVREGAFGMMLMSAVALMMSSIQPTLLKLIPNRPVWSFAQVLFGVCMTIPMLDTSRSMALIIAALSGVDFTTFQSVPFALMQRATDKSEQGNQLGLMNAFCVVAQLVSMLIAGSLVMTLAGNTRSGLFVGAIFSYLCAVLVFILHPSDYPEKEE